VSSEGLSPAQLERLYEVGRALVSELDLESVLRRVLEAARDLTEARYAALGVLDEEKEELERFIFVGVDEATRRQIGPLPRGRGVLGELIRNPEPLRLSDVHAHPRSYGFPASHPEMKTFLGAPVLIRGEAYGNLYLTDKRGEAEFDEQDEQVLVVLAEWAGVAIENARLYERAEKRRVELERAVRGLRATVSLSREVGGETELERVLELVSKRARDLVDARALLALLPRDGDLVVAMTAGKVPDAVRGRSLTVDASPAMDALRSEAATRIADPARIGMSELGIESSIALLAPMVHGGKREGVLVALDRLDSAQEFTADDELLLSSFAASAATAVAMVQAVETEKLHLSIAASERERRRWARELHDDTLQQLGALKVMHDTALQRGDAEVMRRSLEQATSQLQLTITSLEGLINELRPAALDQLGVAAALEALIHQARDAFGLEVVADIGIPAEPRPGARLAPELEQTVYRLAQEGLNNIVKHAGADRVRISVREDGDALVLEVEDDGRGFDPQSAPRRFGLVGMQERVLLAGGELRIESEPKGGTRVTARLPLAYAGSDAEA